MTPQAMRTPAPILPPPIVAAAMPRLILEARRVASTVIHGLHGRRRAGPGENFWQYRRFTSGESAQNIDWRRSARDDHPYVREREWEAAPTPVGEAASAAPVWKWRVDREARRVRRVRRCRRCW